MPFEIYTNNVNAGDTATIAIGGAVPTTPVFLGYSISGSGPTQTVYGVVEMSLPINSLGPFTANNNGLVEITSVVPAQLLGRTIWAQSLNIASGSSNISLPAKMTIQ